MKGIQRYKHLVGYKTNRGDIMCRTGSTVSHIVIVLLRGWSLTRYNTSMPNRDVVHLPLI